MSRVRRGDAREQVPDTRPKANTLQFRGDQKAARKADLIRANARRSRSSTNDRARLGRTGGGD
jgi:hypothetical protein